MRSRKALRLVAAVSLTVLLSVAAPAYAEDGDRGGTESAQTAQAEPAESLDTGLLAGAIWVLLLPLVLLARLKVSAARRTTWWSSLPGLDISQISDFLEDYRLEPESQFRRWVPFWGWPLQ